ncbi:unnamed protein product [Heligmosomoides polygyrus]|uniref:EGF_CA domain-containing protein n=1 Tax=Heligmosomoides polygyrus TaxID=6339 RepID=A0A3P8BPY4_HELPZ|nr:unnamed protein product [Heligmosomoides polygyrus]
MRNGRVSDALLSLNGTSISECSSYTYLGREVNMANDLAPELSRGKRAAWEAVAAIKERNPWRPFDGAVAVEERDSAPVERQQQSYPVHFRPKFARVFDEERRRSVRRSKIVRLRAQLLVSIDIPSPQKPGQYERKMNRDHHRNRENDARGGTTHARQPLRTECVCERGFDVLGANADDQGRVIQICRDIDECATHPCETEEECINTPGSFICGGVPDNANCPEGSQIVVTGPFSYRCECSWIYGGTECRFPLTLILLILACIFLITTIAAILYSVFRKRQDRTGTYQLYAVPDGM